MHRALRQLLLALPRGHERVFTAPASTRYPAGDGSLNERTVLGTLKDTCAACGFTAARRYKLHSFRHAFCSMCARNNVSYKYALAWMGHSDSRVLDLCHTMFDGTAEAAMDTIAYATAEAAVS